MKITAVSGARLVVTGAGGRIGRLLRLNWGQQAAPAFQPVWQSRSASGSDGFCWDFNGQVPDAWPMGAAVLHLAGQVSGSARALHANVTLASAIGRAAAARQAPCVFFASTVAVYAPGPGPISEDQPPQPGTDYGQSKWQAEKVLRHELSASGSHLTCLRIANVAGADALLGGGAGRRDGVVLDPVPGQNGPERSYIGPLTLARVVSALVVAALARRIDLPDTLNIAQPGRVAMGDLLTAAGLDWRFGPPRPGVIARVQVDTSRLQALTEVAPATPAGLVAELAALSGRWP